MIDVCLLGCGGIMPLRERALTSLLIRCGGRLLLVDCGEGTQVQLREAGWGLRALDTVLITHCHADHISGLPGLLLTLGGSGRTEPLRIFGPPGTRRAVEGLTVIAPRLPFELEVDELLPEQQSFAKAGPVTLSCLPVRHSVECMAYRFDLPRAGQFDPGKAKENGVPLKLWKRLQQGEFVHFEGRLFSPGMVLGKPRSGLRLCYCTDARPSPELALFAADADLLVCEGLYGDDSLREKAQEKGHMIFSEAACLARESGCRELWLTHYSPALDDPEAFVPGARGIFQNLSAGHDLMKKALRFRD